MHGLAAVLATVLLATASHAQPWLQATTCEDCAGQVGVGKCAFAFATTAQRGRLCCNSLQDGASLTMHASKYLEA